MHRRLALVAFTLLVAGCSGGHSGSGGSLPVAPAGTTPQSTATANAQVSIVIPKPTAAQAVRRSQYISSSTQSMSFAATNSTPVVAALTTGSPGCATGNSGLQCTVNVALPVGANQQFVVATFASTDGTGTPLATNKVTASIVAGQSNPISLTLDGVPASVVFSPPTTPVPSVAATSIPLTVNVKDAAGNTIVGSAFTDASGNAVTVTLADGDTTGATTLSPSSITQPGTATLAYDNYFQPTTVALSASASTMQTSTTQLAFAAKPVIFAYASGDDAGPGDPITFGASSGIESRSRRHGSAGGRRSAQSVTSTGVQTLGALLLTNSTSLPYTLGTHTSSSATGFAKLNNMIFDVVVGGATLTGIGIATAPNGHAYITESFNGQTGIFDAGTTPAWPAGSSIIAQPFGPIALGPGGKMYAGVMGGFEQINPATGAAIGAQVSVPGTFNSTIPNAIAVGKDGTVYIEAFQTSDGGDDVLAFTSTTSGFTFSHSFATANSHQTGDAIYGLAVDASNNVYISCDCGGYLDIVPSSSQGEVVPARVISNDNNIDDGANVLVDRAGNIIWATWETVSIYAPTAGSVPPPGTNPTTPWSPSTDTAALQTLTDPTDTYNDAFILLSFGPGS